MPLAGSKTTFGQKSRNCQIRFQHLQTQLRTYEMCTKVSSGLVSHENSDLLQRLILLPLLHSAGQFLDFDTLPIAQGHLGTSC